jgi:hypothetical protein
VLGYLLEERTTRRRAHKTTTQIYEADGRKKTYENEIMATYVDFCKRSYELLTVDHQSMGLFRRMQETPEAPRREEELWTAVKQGPYNRSPSEDAICREFYVAYWETLNMTVYALSRGKCD